MLALTLSENEFTAIYSVENNIIYMLLSMHGASHQFCQWFLEFSGVCTWPFAVSGLYINDIAFV